MLRRLLLLRTARKQAEWNIRFDPSDGQAAVNSWFYGDLSAEEREFLTIFAGITYVTKVTFNLGAPSFSFGGDPEEEFEHPWEVVSAVRDDRDAVISIQIYRRRDGSPFLQSPLKGRFAREGAVAEDSVPIFLNYLISGDVKRARVLIKGVEKVAEYYDGSAQSQVVAPLAATADLIEDGDLADPYNLLVESGRG
jgi:hypothetical protein